MFVLGCLLYPSNEILLLNLFVVNWTDDTLQRKRTVPIAILRSSLDIATTYSVVEPGASRLSSRQRPQLNQREVCSVSFEERGESAFCLIVDTPESGNNQQQSPADGEENAFCHGPA